MKKVREDFGQTRRGSGKTLGLNHVVSGGHFAEIYRDHMKSPGLLVSPRAWTLDRSYRLNPGTVRLLRAPALRRSFGQMA